MKRALQWARNQPGLWVGIIATLIVFKDLLAVGGENLLWANDLDPRLMHWTVEWGHHALLGPESVWNANSFYPKTSTLAYSDSLLGLQIFYSPLRLLGVSSVAALYVTLALFCVLGSVLTQQALKRLGEFTNVEIALIVFGAHFSLGVVSYFYHYQLFGFQLAPPFFLFTYLYFRDFKVWDLLGVCACFALGISVAMYLAPFLTAITVFAVLPLTFVALRNHGFKGLVQRVGWVSPLVFAAFSFLIFQLHMRPYVRVARRFDDVGMDQAVSFSAYWWSLFRGFSKHSQWYEPAGNVWGQWEHWYFPGYLLLGAAAACVVVLIVQRIRRDTPPIPRALLGFAGVVFVLAWVLSWGPFWRTDNPVTYLPFYFLADVIPGLESVRAPGRFGMFLGLPLAIAAVGFIRVVVVSPTIRTWITAGFLAAVAVESFPVFSVHPFHIDKTGTYARVGEVIEPGTPLLQLPVYGGTSYGTLKVTLAQLNGSTLHWGRLVTGYGAHTTSAYSELADLDRRVQAGELSPGVLVDFAMRYEMSHVMVELPAYDEAIREQWNELLDGPTTTSLLTLPAARLVRFDFDSARASREE